MSIGVLHLASYRPTPSPPRPRLPPFPSRPLRCRDRRPGPGAPRGVRRGVRQRGARRQRRGGGAAGHAGGTAEAGGQGAWAVLSRCACGRGWGVGCGGRATYEVCRLTRSVMRRKAWEEGMWRVGCVGQQVGGGAPDHAGGAAAAGGVEGRIRGSVAGCGCMRVRDCVWNPRGSKDERHRQLQPLSAVYPPGAHQRIGVVVSCCDKEYSHQLQAHRCDLLILCHASHVPRPPHAAAPLPHSNPTVALPVCPC